MNIVRVLLCALILLGLVGCVDSRGYPLGSDGQSYGKPLQVELDGGSAVTVNVYANDNISAGQPTDIDGIVTGNGTALVALAFSGNATEYLDGTGAFSTPAGTGVAVLDDLTDVNVPAPTDGQVLTWDNGAGEWVSENATGGGDMTKSVYDPNDDGIIATAQLDTSVVITTDVDDTPVDAATTDPISSNWAYDHADNTTTHGATGAIVGTTNTQELDNKTLDSSVGKGTWTVSGTWTLPAMTFGGNVTLGEISIILDSSLSADGYASGIAEAGTAGAALAFGDLVYLAVADSRWELADADQEATAKGKIGICIQAAAGDGSATMILLWGKVRADAVFPALTVGAPVFISATDGDVTSTAPSGTGDIVRVVGYGNTADELFFDPDGTWIELA